MESEQSYPEVNIEVPATPELPIADLERDRHAVIAMQVFVEAFSRVRLQLDGVC